MWKNCSPLFCIVFAAVSPALAAAGEIPSPQELFDTTCSSCHPAKKAAGKDYSAGKWRATVARMRKHAADTEHAFSAETGEQIARYLAGGDGDAPGAATAPGTGGGPALATAGKVLGVITAVLIAGMITAGLLRRKLGKRFRPLHAAGAAVLLAAAAAHAVILYLHAGPPAQPWHLCGTAAILVALGTAGGGLLRRRLKKMFLPLHVTGALAAAALVLLHRLLY